MIPVDNNNGNNFKHKSHLTTDIVLISVIIIGFIGSVVIYMSDIMIPAIIISVLLGSAVSALVYRFLGGISSDSSFTVFWLPLIIINPIPVNRDPRLYETGMTD